MFLPWVVIPKRVEMRTRQWGLNTPVLFKISEYHTRWKRHVITRLLQEILLIVSEKSVLDAVRIRVQDAIWTVMNNVVMPRVEMAVIWMTGLSGQRPNSTALLTREIFQVAWKILRSIRHLDLNINNTRNDETRISKILEDGNFEAIKLNYDRQTETRHMKKNTFLARLSRNLENWPIF